jgi:hypothetical protein
MAKREAVNSDDNLERPRQLRQSHANRALTAAWSITLTA